MLKEFRDFAMKGNVVDLAVGVIIGAAFGAIVASLVADVIMPLIGAITGGSSRDRKLAGASTVDSQGLCSCAATTCTMKVNG